LDWRFLDWRFLDWRLGFLYCLDWGFLYLGFLYCLDWGFLYCLDWGFLERLQRLLQEEHESTSIEDLQQCQVK
jgi:hypothetical protein